jgi:hypothetical protein
LSRRGVPFGRDAGSQRLSIAHYSLRSYKWRVNAIRNSSIWNREARRFAYAGPARKLGLRGYLALAFGARSSTFRSSLLSKIHR